MLSGMICINQTVFNGVFGEIGCSSQMKAAGKPGFVELTVFTETFRIAAISLRVRPSATNWRTSRCLVVSLSENELPNLIQKAEPALLAFLRSTRLQRFTKDRIASGDS